MSSAIEVGNLPVIRREDIRWRTVGSDVQISIGLHNDSSESTGPATLVIEAAAFGAFVPSEPVARVAVAGFEPDERRRVVTRVPRALLDELVANSALRRDPSMLEDYRGVNWVGNLNIYFDTAPHKAVERHVAFDIKVQAARRIGFRFFVREDAGYKLETSCSHPSWTAEAVFDSSRWLARGVVIVTPPATPGLKSKVEVSVTRQSDGKTVLVEFEFETVESASDTLGCLQV